jgi:membrane associated rhomboid family serine protease
MVIILIIAGVFYAYWKKMYLTHMLILLMVVIYLITVLTSDIVSDLRFSPIYRDLAFNPANLKTGTNLYQVITSEFVHNSPLHLIFNVLALAMLGLRFEEKVEALRYGIIFFVSGALATVLFALTSNFQPAYLVGASGGLFGIMGAYARLYPREKFMFFPIMVPLPIFTWTFLLIIISILFHFVPDLCLLPDVAHIAHVEGAFVGLAIAPLVMKIESKEKKKKLKPVDFKALETLAKSDEEKELLAKIKSEDEPEVRDAWLEHFLTKAKCPQCGGNFEIRGRTLKSTCGYEIKY